jgi:hypothetical protein
MEATRLAPAGRACSKFIWQQCRFQKNWAVRVLPRSGRPAFLVAPKLWRDRSRTGAEQEFDFGFDVSLRTHRVGRFGAAMRFNPAQTTMRHSCDAKENGPDRGPVSASWLGHVVAAIGRHFWRAEYGGTAASATASYCPRQSAALARGLRFGSRGPEFISEFETKQGQ